MSKALIFLGIIFSLVLSYKAIKEARGEIKELGEAVADLKKSILNALRPILEPMIKALNKIGIGR